MDRGTDGVADAGDGSEGVGAGPQVGDFPQELEAVPLFLQRIGFGIGRAQNCERLGGQFNPLTFAGAFLEFAGDAQARTGGRLLDVNVVAGNIGADHDLQIGQATAVVQLDERKTLLGITPCADPAGDFECLPGLARFQNVGDARNHDWLVNFDELLRASL